MTESKKSRRGFAIDEEPLRESVLKAYFKVYGPTAGAPPESVERSPGSRTPDKARRGIDAVRQFLSGAPGR